MIHYFLFVMWAAMCAIGTLAALHGFMTAQPIGDWVAYAIFALIGALFAYRAKGRANAATSRAEQ